MKTCLLITTFNRATQLRHSLERLRNLTLPDEVLIVDDGSGDGTRATVEEFKSTLPVRYIYNNNPNWSICSFARNIGVKQTDADIIITSEPECLWITDIVPHVVQERDQYPRQIISAGVVYHMQTRTDYHPGWVSDPMAALHDMTVQEYEIQPRSYTQTGLVRTLNMQATFVCMYEREWLMRLGGWDESFTGAWGWDDVDLATRLRISGINQHICPDMSVIHQFHEHLPPHLQGQASHDNEMYMISKHLNEITDQNDPRLIANQGKDWGVITV